MIALVVLSVILAAMLAAFLWFYWYSRTPAWGDSESRKAILNMLVVVGPIFGMRYRPPRPEPPSIATPFGNDPQPAHDVRLEPSGDAEQRP